MIVCRSPAEIERMRRAGEIVAQALELGKSMTKPGTATTEIDSAIAKLIAGRKARAAFKGYRGYPASTCISINEEVVHGIPGSRPLESGQVVSIDVGVELEGYFADAATTFAVGEVPAEARKLMAAGEAALGAGIRMMRAGKHLYDISAVIQETAEAAGYSVVRDYVGHGIGRRMHEEPQIPNYAQSSRGPKLAVGMVFALEPMVNGGGSAVELLADDWTVVTADRKLSVHYEHTVALTEDGPVVLTEL
jgi:methionyl aminopeptidase